MSCRYRQLTKHWVEPNINALLQAHIIEHVICKIFHFQILWVGQAWEAKDLVEVALKSFEKIENTYFLFYVIIGSKNFQSIKSWVLYKLLCIDIHYMI